MASNETMEAVERVLTGLDTTDGRLEKIARIIDDSTRPPWISVEEPPDKDGVYQTWNADTEHLWYRLWEEGVWWLHSYLESDVELGEWSLVPNNSFNHWMQRPEPPEISEGG